MSLINISNLTFGYDGSYDNIFENVSFQIDTDWKLGFTGRNGRGKTTFLKLLQGKLEYTGTITSGVDFEYFPFDIPDKTLMTQEIADGICDDIQRWQLIRELNLLSVNEDVLYRPFYTLSNGEQTKVMLAALFLRENNFLLIDEPTNHLDTQARQIVGRYLDSKKGFILVSHDRNFLDSCVDHILSINITDIEIQKGNFSSWFVNKQAKDSYEQSENDKLKKDIRRLSEAAKRTSQWSDKAESRKIGFDPVKVEKSLTRRPMEGRKAKKMMSRSKQIEARQQKALDEKSGLLKNTERISDLKIHPLKFHSRELVSIRDLCVSYGVKNVCTDVSFQINQGDRLALCGKNGCGKSSILKLLCGQDIPHSGEIIMNNQLIISYVAQDTSFLHGDLKEFAENQQIDESLFKAILRKLDFSREQFEKDIDDFSAGQRKKVLIASSLCQQAHLYIWDEPLNFIDVFSRMQIEQLLTTFSPSMIFVEHDEAFQDNIASQRIYIG
ncbi:MAG: ABC-F type ribosomal protection protein [Oscillospiraceae bacterium]|nr:ABC-F type ribosomal protection protein [Oscillospiraceae bacterium]